MNTVEIILITVGAVLLFYFAVCNVIVNLFFIRPKKRTLKNLKEDEIVSKKLPQEFLDIPFTHWIIENDEGKCFGARFYGADSDKYVIVLHGHNAHSLGAIRFLGIFRALHYNVIMPDLLRSGMSDGKKVSFGIHESDVVLRWIARIKEKSERAFIGIMGISMGGATAVMSAAKSRDIRFMVGYCPYASVFSILQGITKRYKPLALFAPGIRLMFLVNGLNFKKNSPLNAAKDITCPSLLIHSKGDMLVNHENSAKIYENLVAAPIKAIKYFEHAKHGHSPTMYRKEFEMTVTDFVKQVESYFEKKQA